MKSFEIKEKKAFMSALLVGEVFDSFALSELLLNSACRLEIDGHRNEAFYTEEERVQLPEREYVLWSEWKPQIFQMIKGNKTPLSFRIVFRLTKHNTQRVLESLGSEIAPEAVGGLFLNLQYEREQLHIISGISLNTFSLDRTLEQSWDMYAEKFLKKHGIVYETQ